MFSLVREVGLEPGTGYRLRSECNNWYNYFAFHAISVKICAIYALICISMALPKGHERGISALLCGFAGMLQEMMLQGDGIDLEDCATDSVLKLPTFISHEFKKIY